MPSQSLPALRTAVLILVPTIPHSGTHFMRDHLLWDVGLPILVVHMYRSEIDRINRCMDQSFKAIIPRRDPAEVAKSWIRHGKDPDDFDGRTLSQWFAAQQDLADTFPQSTYWIDIDRQDLRDAQLTQINSELGLNLDARGWPVIRQADE